MGHRWSGDFTFWTIFHRENDAARKKFKIGSAASRMDRRARHLV
jgi:hypothetical protein